MAEPGRKQWFGLLDRLQCFFPAVDDGEDAVGIGGPDEGLWRGVMLGDVAVDGGLKIDDGAERPAPEPPLRECGKEGLDRVEPTSTRSG
jgi:hypothetical protein